MRPPRKAGKEERRWTTRESQRPPKDSTLSAELDVYTVISVNKLATGELTRHLSTLTTPHK